MMIYASLDTTGGTIESVWGHEMRVMAIDPSDKDAVDIAKADGWQNSPQAIIDEMDAKALQRENEAMKGKLNNLDGNKRINELEDQLSQALTEIAELEETVTVLTDKVEVYEKAKDTNSNGKVDYDEMTSKELQALLDQRKVDYKARDGKDTLVKLAQDSE